MNQKVTILCIDDEVEICVALKALFRTQGWETITANNVPDGVRQFTKYHPDLVLIDYHMPVVNGIEGVRRLRALSAEVPILVFTIDEDLQVAEGFLAAGASDFALKPIKAPDIVSRIRLHLQLLKQRETANSPGFSKGISQSTLNLILSYLRSCKEPVTANDISEHTGLAYQTVYRYLQQMTQNSMVVMENTYGKIGRPKQLYHCSKID